MSEVLDIDVAWGGFYACASRDSDGISVIRLLDFNRDAYHASLFNERFDAIPGPEVIENLSLSIGHVPIDARGLLNFDTLTLIGRKPLTQDDLVGYMSYLAEFDVSEAEGKKFADSLMAFSNDAPLALRLYLLEGKLQIEERPKGK